MDRDEILEKSKEVSFPDIKPYLMLFIEQCVEKSRRDRWKFSSKSIDDLSLRFNSLWNGISTKKAKNLPKVELTSDTYIYLDLDGYAKTGYLLPKINAEIVGNCPADGILFSKDKSQAIFLTLDPQVFLLKKQKIAI